MDPFTWYEQRQDDQLEPTYNSFVPIQDVALKTYWERWMIEKSGRETVWEIHAGSVTWWWWVATIHTTNINARSILRIGFSRKQKKKWSEKKDHKFGFRLRNFQFNVYFIQLNKKDKDLIYLTWWIQFNIILILEIKNLKWFLKLKMLKTFWSSTSSSALTVWF